MSQLGISSGKILVIKGLISEKIKIGFPSQLLNDDAQAAAIIPLLDFHQGSYTNVEALFKGCGRLTSIPMFDSSNSYSFNATFYGCGGISTIPLIDTHSAYDCTNMFYNCINLTTLPELDLSNAVDLSLAFCNCFKLTNIPNSIYENTVMADLYRTFYYCRLLTEIGDMHTEHVTDFRETFAYCENLTRIGAMNVSQVISFENAFTYCTSLTSIGIYGSRYSIDLSTTGLGHDALVTVLENLGTAINSAQTITLGSTKLALLSDSEKAIATNKNWTLA